MKTLIALSAVVTCCLAAEVPYSPSGSNAQGALLLLPLQQAKNNNNTTSTTPRSLTNGTENLEDVNARLTERLKQEQGSQQGVYHVYLQDGRLQRVQYITAPIVSAQQTQQEQAAPNSYNQEQTPQILSPEFAERRGVYFVQVPQERIQALQGNAQKVSTQSRVSQTTVPAQYNEQPSYSPVNVRYLPLEDTPVQFQRASSQYNQEPSAEVPVVRYLPVPLTEEAQQYGRQERPSGLQAVVQYSEVQPIQGPVYSYRPDGITRILRYAPVY